MIYPTIRVLLAVACAAFLATAAKADPPKGVNTEKNKAVVLGTFLSAPSNCGSNPGAVPCQQFARNHPTALLDFKS
jgi:hypothetical protein